METFFSKIESHLKQNLPFVVYNKPNEAALIGLFQKNGTVYLVKDFEESGFLFAPFYGNEIVLIPENRCEILTEKWVSENLMSDAKVASEHDSTGKESFEKLVQKGVEFIANAAFQKVVLSRNETISIEEFNVISTFKKLLIAYPTAFNYCFFHPKIGMWFGASPEQLLKVKTNTFETIALAGTQKFQGIEDVAWGDKEQHEQQFVTDFILENLENVTSDIAFTNPYTHRAGNLLHLKTDISGTLNTHSNVKQLVEILHPTPAVCGFPKEAAREFILKNEGYDRKYYSGYLGELNADWHLDKRITDLFVNLRCMEIKENEAIIYVGCGITKGSNPEKEFIETVNKSMTMKKILNMNL